MHHVSAACWCFRLRKSPSQTKAAADERHARAERLRTALAEEKLARLVQEKLAKQQRRKQVQYCLQFLTVSGGFELMPYGSFN